MGGSIPFPKGISSKVNVIARLDECIGEKLTVNKHRWLYVYVVLIYVYTLNQWQGVLFIYTYSKPHYQHICVYVCVCVCLCVCVCVHSKKRKFGDLSRGWPEGSLEKCCCYWKIATTPCRCKGGRYSFPSIAPLYPWSLPYNAEC